MARRLLSLLTALSLLVLVAATGAWAAGAWRLRTVGLFETRRAAVWFAAGNGRLIYLQLEHRLDTPSEARRIRRMLSESMAGRPWSHGGFTVGGSPIRGWDANGQRTVEGSWGAIAVPLWAVVALSAPLPAWRLWKRLRRPRPAGLCRRCGYDLRATPQRCPECGTAPATPA